jgi:hypothetical protein
MVFQQLRLCGFWVCILAYQALSLPMAKWLMGSDLVHPRVRRKRSRGLVILLLPALIFIGLLGWCMMMIDDNHKPTRPKRPAQKDHVTLIPIVFEEQHQIRMRNATGNR